MSTAFFNSTLTVMTITALVVLLTVVTGPSSTVSSLTFVSTSASVSISSSIQSSISVSDSPSWSTSISPTHSVPQSTSATVAISPTPSATSSTSTSNSVSHSPSVTNTPSVTSSASVTNTPSVTSSPAVTNTPSVSSSIAPTSSVSPSGTISPSPSPDVLPHGLVYTGGQAPLSASVEMWNQGAWQLFSGMEVFRWKHTCAIRNGQYWYIGGEISPAVGNDIELRILETNTSAPSVEIATNLTVLRTWGARAETLSNGMYMFGGWQVQGNMLSGNCTRVPLNALAIEQCGIMVRPRYYFASAILNDKIYAIGGINATSLTASVEWYDLGLDQWTELDPSLWLQTPRYHFAAASVGAYIYAIGGYAQSFTELSSVERFNGVNPWVEVAPLLWPRHSHTAAVYSGLVWVAGGEIVGPPPRNTSSYDPVTDAWTDRPNVLTETVYGCMATLP